MFYPFKCICLLHRVCSNTRTIDCASIEQLCRGQEKILKTLTEMSHQLRNLMNSQSKAKLEEPFVFSPASTSEELDALVKRPEVVSIGCY